MNISGVSAVSLICVINSKKFPGMKANSVQENEKAVDKKTLKSSTFLN